jgi:hemerythrin
LGKSNSDFNEGAPDRAPEADPRQTGFKGGGMSIIRWNDDLNLGVAEIDAQHRQLVNAINELHVAVEYSRSQEVILPLIERLLEYSRAHFQAEEQLLSDIGFPGIAGHKQEHQHFITKIHNLSHQFSYNRDFLAVHVKDFLLAWFYNHIQTKDMEYKAQLD